MGVAFRRRKMQYQKSQTKVLSTVRFDHIARLAIALAAFLLIAHSRTVKADSLQDQIDAANRQVAQSQAQVNEWQAKADTLNNHLALLNAKIAANQAALDLARARQAQLSDEIAKANADLKKKQAILGENVRLIYQTNQVTPLEMLFSSGNLSDFLDGQQYLERIKDNIQRAVAQIADLKRQLEDESKQLESTIAQQQSLLYGLSQQQNEVNALLAETQGQESVYQSKLKGDKAKLSQLEAQQAALIAANSGGSVYGGTGGYPWAGEPQDGGVDPWGFYWRECTSYAAWKRSAIGRPIPAWGYMGQANAKDWVNWAHASGMRVDHNPEYGAIGVYTGGEFGHVMIVEAVTGAQVFVSQYNADFSGRYSESYWNSSSLWFIH